MIKLQLVRRPNLSLVLYLITIVISIHLLSGACHLSLGPHPPIPISVPETIQYHFDGASAREYFF